MKWFPLILWSLLCAAAVVVILSAPPLQNDMGQFLPDSANPKQQLILDEIRRGTAARVVLLELSGAAPERLASASRVLARELRGSGHFSLVINGGATPGTGALETLFEHRYLLVTPQPDAFGPEALQRALEQRLAELSLPVGMPDKERLPADPTASFRDLLQRWKPVRTAARQRHGLWFSADGSRALLMLHSRYPVFDLDRQQQAIAAIHAAFRNLPGDGQTRMRMSGPPVFAVEARDSIRGEAQTLSLAASSGVSLLLLLAYRSMRLMLVAALPLASGILAGTASVILMFGELHGIALAFGITLIGVAVDYPIHLFTHAGGRADTSGALSDIWPIMRLSLLTTALGFSTLILSDFGGLSQLGGFAVTGLIAAALVTRFILPRLARRVRARSRLEGPAVALFRHLRLPWLPSVVLVLAVAVLVARGEHLWEHELARLSPISSEARAVDRLLRRELGAPDAVRLLLLRGDTAQEVLELSEDLERGLARQLAEGGLDGFDLPSRYLPSAKTQQSNRDALPEGDALREALNSILAGFPFKPGLFEPFLRDLQRARTLAPLTPQQLAGSPLSLRMAPLLSRRGEGWVGLATLAGIRDEAAIERLAGVAGEGVTYLNMAEESARMVTGYRDEALRLSALGAVVILVVLTIALRDLRLTARVFSPVTAAVLGTAAVLSLAGQQLSLFHIAALLLVMGIGIDYALFIARTPRDDPRYAATAGSLLLCNLSTLMVFGLLATSDLPVLFTIGMTVATGALLSLAFSAMMVRSVKETGIGEVVTPGGF